MKIILFCIVAFLNTSKMLCQDIFLSLDTTMAKESKRVMVNLCDTTHIQNLKNLMKYEKVKELQLNNCHVLIPENFPNMNSVDRLRIYNPNIDSILFLYKRFPNLNSLIIKGDTFSGLHLSGINNFKMLEILSLSNLDFDKINNDICFIDSLKSLFLENNNIKIFPPDFFRLNLLRVLVISNNKLTFLPKDILKLKSLEILDLSRNPIKELPVELFKLKRIKEIKLLGCPIDNSYITKLRELYPHIYFEFYSK